jgi:hypothetical protein
MTVSTATSGRTQTLASHQRAQAEELAEARAVLGDAEFATAWAEGCALDLNDAVARAAAEQS